MKMSVPFQDEIPGQGNWTWLNVRGRARIEIKNDAVKSYTIGKEVAAHNDYKIDGKVWFLKS